MFVLVCGRLYLQPLQLQSNVWNSQTPKPRNPEITLMISNPAVLWSANTKIIRGDESGFLWTERLLSVSHFTQEFWSLWWRRFEIPRPTSETHLSKSRTSDKLVMSNNFLCCSAASSVVLIKTGASLHNLTWSHFMLFRIQQEIWRYFLFVCAEWGLLTLSDQIQDLRALPLL